MTKLPDPRILGKVLTDRFGLVLDVRAGQGADGAYIDIRPGDLHENEGFVVHVVIGWRSVLAHLRFGKFARDLLAEVEGSSGEQRSQYAGMARALADQGAAIKVRINGSVVDALHPETWPEVWTAFELDVERIPIMLDHDDEAHIREAVLSWAGGLVGMIVCLLPLEDIEPEEHLDLRGLPEGARQRIEVNRYERSRVNRALCISIHGTTCAACGFNFEAVYGPIGRDFIHVHHKVPVSRIGAGYEIDPVNDLVPVCPNCHAMLHRRDPPLALEELKRALEVG